MACPGGPVVVVVATTRLPTHSEDGTSDVAGADVIWVTVLVVTMQPPVPQGASDDDEEGAAGVVLTLRTMEPDGVNLIALDIRLRRI